MSTAPHKLSRPVYEGLPWVYLLGGLAALMVSYFQESAAEDPKNPLASPLYADLTGLPPSAHDLEQFVQSGSDQSYESAVDRMLASDQSAGRVDIAGNRQAA